MAKYAVSGGHSKKAPGASSYIDEYTEDRKVCNALVDELKARGHSVTNCSNEESTQAKELSKEVSLANASGASLFNAIHFNADHKTSGTVGVEVWYYTGSSQGKKYALAIAKALSKALGLPNRGAKATKSLYVIRETSMTAVLTEVCFVDAKGDVDAYQKLGAEGVAKAIADGMTGVATSEPAASTSSSSSSTSNSSSSSSGSSSIKTVQKWVGTTQDGIYGPKTESGLIKKLQTELNKQFGKGLDVDGIWGPKTQAACVNVKKGAEGNLTKTLQGALICHGYSTNGFDGIFGSGTESAVKKFQKAKGLTQDGIAGKNTWTKLLG